MNTFLQINLLLCLTGFCSLLADKILLKARVKVPSLRILRFSQILFLVCLILPIALKYFPKTSLRGVSSPTFKAFDQGIIAPLHIQLQKEKTYRPTGVSPHPAEEIELNYSLLIWVFWILGSAAFVTKFVLGYFQLKKILHQSVSLKSYGSVRIVATDQVFVPFSVRTFENAWVVLPFSVLTEPKDLFLVLKHEIQHHRQGDTWWAMLMEAGSCFFFFNPAIYLWKNIITEQQEFSCDEALSGHQKFSSQEYGSCLLRVAEAALDHRQMYAGTTSMAAIIKDSEYFKTFLLRRIEMITDEKSSKRTWMAMTAGLLITTFSIGFAIGAEKLARGQGSINPGILELDRDVQKIAEDSLSRALSRMKATGGFIIVAEPSTGRILAVANKDKVGQLKGNWALNELMETASIAKPIVVAEAFEKGLTDLQARHNCENGQYNYNGKIYRDWKRVGWSSLTTSQTIELSSDICSIKIAEKIGESGLKAMLEKFGFGEGGTARNFPEARSGERPEKGPQYLPQVTAGFGFRSSPLEVLQAYGAIANGGHLMEPVSYRQKSKNLRRVLSEDTAAKMRELLENVVLHGTGKNAQSDLFTTAGKTATALMNDFMNIEWYGSKNMANVASFIGFAPVNRPRVQVYVGLINPNTDNTGAHGGAHAAPVFREVIENVLTHMKVDPDKK